MRRDEMLRREADDPEFPAHVEAARDGTPAAPLPSGAGEPVAWDVLDGSGHAFLLTRRRAECESAIRNHESCARPSYVGPYTIRPLYATPLPTLTGDAGLPEVTAEDLAKVRRAAHGILGHVSDEDAHEFYAEQMPLDTARRIYAVLDALHARQRDGK